MRREKILELLDRIYRWVEQVEGLTKELLIEKQKMQEIYAELLKEYERRKVNRN